MGLIENNYMQGFAPADEVPSTDSGQALLFRQKDPKLFSPVPAPHAPAWAASSDASASAPNPSTPLRIGHMAT